MPQFLLLKKVKQDNLINEPIANSHVSIYYKKKNKNKNKSSENISNLQN